MPLPNIPTGIENQANTAFNEIKTAVDNYQTTYLANNGKYWQGIKSSDTPQDGANKAMELTRKPTDQTEDWSWFTPSGSYPISFEVHTHDGPNGKSYSVVGHINIAGQEWVRVNDGEWLEQTNDI